MWRDNYRLGELQFVLYWWTIPQWQIPTLCPYVVAQSSLILLLDRSLVCFFEAQFFFLRAGCPASLFHHSQPQRSIPLQHCRAEEIQAWQRSAKIIIDYITLDLNPNLKILMLKKCGPFLKDFVTDHDKKENKDSLTSQFRVIFGLPASQGSYAYYCSTCPPILKSCAALTSEIFATKCGSA